MPKTNENNTAEITVIRKGHISFVCLNRPKHNNALSFKILQALNEIALGFVDDIETRTVIFCAKGDNFSFGADLKDLQKQRAKNPPLVLRRRQMAQGATLLKSIRNIPQITICAVQGLTIGGGAAIASACDFRIGSPDCKISYGEVKLGMNLMWQALPLCVQLIGAAKTKKMVLSGQFENAETLLQWGFLDEITPDGELLDRAISMAEQYAAMPPAAVQAIKASVNAISDALSSAVMHMEADQFLLLQNSEDASEALQAMQEKRSGRFTGW